MKKENNLPFPSGLRSLRAMPLILSLAIPAIFGLFIPAEKHQKHVSPSCKIRTEYLGTWSAENSDVTVRTEPEKWHFEFTKGKADFSITINADKTASGHIGAATFEHARMAYNGPLSPEWTGIIYTIRCGKIGKIFDADPVPEKKVWLSISPIREDGTMEVGLRFGNFPMAGFLCKKSN